MQKMIDEEKPGDESQLKVAILKAARALPQADIIKAIRQFGPRCELCVSTGGGHFEHKKKRAGVYEELEQTRGHADHEEYEDFEEIEQETDSEETDSEETN